MTGKKIVFVIIAFSIIAIILAWFALQYIIVEYNIDSALEQTKFIVNIIINNDLIV